MDVDFGVIWGSDFYNAIRFLVSPARRPKDTRRLPSQQNIEEVKDVTL